MFHANMQGFVLTVPRLEPHLRRDDMGLQRGREIPKQPDPMRAHGEINVWVIQRVQVGVTDQYHSVAVMLCGKDFQRVEAPPHELLL